MLAIGYLFSGNALKALFYISQCVSTGEGKPPIPTIFHNRVHLILTQIFFSLTSREADVEIPAKLKTSIQDFISLTLADSAYLDLSKLSREMVVRYCRTVQDKLGLTQQALSNSRVTQYGRIYHHIDGSPFNPDMFPFRLDHVKSVAYTLSYTQTKLMWLSKENDKALQHCQNATGQVLGIFRPIATPTTLLLIAAQHFEAEKSLSPSIISGIVTYHHYSLWIDLIGSIMDGQWEGTKIPTESRGTVRRGFLDIVKQLILQGLCVCEECVDGFITAGSKVKVPCSHALVS